MSSVVKPNKLKVKTNLDIVPQKTKQCVVVPVSITSTKLVF